MVQAAYLRDREGLAVVRTLHQSILRGVFIKDQAFKQEDKVLRRDFIPDRFTWCRWAHISSLSSSVVLQLDGR